MKKIYYVGFYDTYQYEHENRLFAPSAKNKMDYIIKTIEKNGYYIDILSPSWTANTSGKYPKRNIKLSEYTNLIMCSTFGAKNKFMKFFRKYIPICWLFMKLVFSVSKKDTVIVYHSIYLLWTVYLAKKIKNFKLILEVEEIYQDVKKYNIITKKMEYKLFNVADKYIFSNDILNKKINKNSKPYTVIYGAYQVERDRGVKFNDNKIHVVYAGILDQRKGGAIAAVAAEYLPKNYHVHIIGFGSEADIKYIKNIIEEVSKRTEATVTYEGLLKGERYIEFLQKCQIGLCTQTPNADFNSTSFPSKILSYMSNGLRVVSARIKAVEKSVIGDHVYYYDKQDPKVIADTIMNVDLKQFYNSREVVSKLIKSI